MTLPTSSGTAFLPYGRHVIDDDDIAAVTKVLRSDRLTTSPAVESFEAALSARMDGAQAVAVSSGAAVRFTDADVIFPDVGSALIINASCYRDPSRLKIVGVFRRAL